MVDSTIRSLHQKTAYSWEKDCVWRLGSTSFKFLVKSSLSLPNNVFFDKLHDSSFWGPLLGPLSGPALKNPAHLKRSQYVCVCVCLCEWVSVLPDVWSDFYSSIRGLLRETWSCEDHEGAFQKNNFKNPPVVAAVDALDDRGPVPSFEKDLFACGRSGGRSCSISCMDVRKGANGKLLCISVRTLKAEWGECE
jgi:hypothetical protein